LAVIADFVLGDIEASPYRFQGFLIVMRVLP